ELPLLVKLDTNGQLTDELKKVLSTGLVDYVAMDIKAPKGKYELVTKGADEEAIFKSAEFILNQDVDYEFRTTYMPLLDLEDIEEIAKTLKGAKAYYIQQYRKPPNIKGRIFPEPVSIELVKKAADIAKKYIPNTQTRGV
ncbi:MAG: anaerobic ribonucleoside-triphosphate reductase activating protein, partial [Eubacteriales bacterium]